MQPTKRFGLILVVSVIFVIVLGSCTSLDSRRGPAVKVVSIKIGMEATPVNSLVYIAENQKYFEANNLKLIVKDNYPSGSAAAEGMLKGEVDIATAAELAIVRQAFAKEKISTFGTIDKFMHQYLIARKDRGINNVSDLKGKRIGVPLKTGAQFNFDRFLDLRGLDKSQVSLVDVQAPQALAAVTNGDVDAIVAWQPNVMAIKERLGDKARIWSVHNGQPSYCAAVTGNGWAKKNPELINRFIRALAQAEDYLINNPAQARGIVQKRLGYSDAYIKAIWPEHRFSLSLDQSLIVAMEDQARWLIDNDLTTETAVPDFSSYVDVGALKAIKPESVNIIK